MKIEVLPSPIHGHGVFAKRGFSKGDHIGRFVSRRVNRDGTYVLWLERDGGWQGYEGYGRLRFLNHRRPANSDFEGLDLYALTNIRPGEEITIDYGDDPPEDD